jgi:hypothetical protein
MFFIPVFTVLIPILIGQRLGLRSSKKLAEIQHAPVGSVVAAAFGLLAFMLAFTFQIASNRYDSRKQLLLDEVTNIRTTYLRAGLIPEPFQSGSRKLLVEYIDLRVELSNNISKLDTVLSRSQQILDTLWGYTETLAQQDRSSEVYALFTSSVNDLVDGFNQRITVTLEYRIPLIVLWVLFIISFFSMLVLGYQFGISGKGSFWVNLLLAIIFAVVIFLIMALDRPEKGLTKLNQAPVFKLQKQLKEKQSYVSPSIPIKVVADSAR